MNFYTILQFVMLSFALRAKPVVERYSFMVFLMGIFKFIIMDIERFFVVTNPLSWLFLILLYVINAVLWFWEKVLWNRKRFYYNLYDYYVTKRRIKKGLSESEIRNIKLWFSREDRKKNKHPYLKELKSLVSEAEINLKMKSKNARR